MAVSSRMRWAWTLAAGLLIAALAAVAPAQQPEPETGNELPIRIAVTDRAELGRVGRLVSIERVRGPVVEASATTDELRALANHGIAWEVLPAATAEDELTMCPAGWAEDDGRSFTCYPSWGQYVALMNRWAADFPDRCRLVDLGPTANAVRPHRLLALVISDSPQLDEDEPEVLLTSSMHGDELGGFVLLLRLIEELLAGAGGDSEVAPLVNSTEIWINPLANPDGTYFAGDDTVAGAIRRYATAGGANSGVDPNRNFPDPDEGEHPDGHPWWPETEAMMALAASRSFVLSANLHSGAELVNYPWDTWQRRHPDNDWFRDLARAWVDLAHADGPGGYMRDRENGITNGWDWYEVAGGRQDFMTFYHGSREITVELIATDLLPADELEALWQWNRRALLDFIAHAHGGIRGIVSDPAGRPLAATVEVVGIDRPADGSTVRSDPAVGDYHRLLLPGLYDLRVAAPGHDARLIEGVAVGEGAATRLDVVLHETLIRRPSRRLVPGP